MLKINWKHNVQIVRKSSWHQIIATLSMESELLRDRLHYGRQFQPWGLAYYYVNGLAVVHSNRYSVLIAPSIARMLPLMKFITSPKQSLVGQGPLGGSRVAATIYLAVTEGVWRSPGIVGKTAWEEDQKKRVEKCQHVRIEEIYTGMLWRQKCNSAWNESWFCGN